MAVKKDKVKLRGFTSLASFLSEFRRRAESRAAQNPSHEPDRFMVNSTSGSWPGAWVSELPDSPGVYLMKNSDDAIIYIGKAKSLRKRVQSYFRISGIPYPKVEFIAKNTVVVDFIQTSCEEEAYLLEANLIKRFKPKYNKELKDDKSFPYLKISVQEEYPMLSVTRKLFSDGAVYYGPYANVKMLKKSVRYLKSVFPVKNCLVMPKRPCLYYHLNQCLGMCFKNINKEQYRDIINDLIMFIEGKKTELIEKIRTKMQIASKELKFEEAGHLRDQLKALTVASSPPRHNELAVLRELKDILNLPKVPKYIEAFDVSNISGAYAVGSMVSFIDGKPYKKGYRKFKIKTVSSIDDYSMMKEIIYRRYKKIIEDNKMLPDLIIVDGGKGHLNVSYQALDELHAKDLCIIAIAKSFEHIYVKDSEIPVKLPNNSNILFLIQNIRDEAHRFAFSYHKVLYEKQSEFSLLDGIPSIGKIRKEALLKHFNSLADIKKASIGELKKIDGIDGKLAEIIKKNINK